MANEASYISPIIQAMIASAQQEEAQQRLQQGEEAQKQQVAAQKQQQSLQEKMVQQAEERLQNEADHNKGMLGVQQSLAEAQIEGNRLNQVKMLHDLIGGGVPAGAIQNQAPAGVDVSQFPGPQQLAQNEAQRIGAATAAQEGARAPFVEQEKQNDFNRAQSLHNLDFQNRMTEVGANNAEAERLAQISGDRSMAVANLNGQYHLRGIEAMHQLGLDTSGGQPDQAKQLVDGLYDGNIDYSKLTQDQKRAVGAYASGTGELSSLPTNTAAYSKKLDAVTGLQTLLNQYRDLAVNYSRDASGAATKGNYEFNMGALGTHGWVSSGSDLDSKMKALSASAGQLATFFDQQNRKSDAEILRKQIGNFDPKATTQQNLQKLQTHVGQLQQGVNNIFQGMDPNRVQTILHNRGISDFGFQQPGAPAPAPQNHPTQPGYVLDPDMTQKMGKPIYKMGTAGGGQ